jgi:3-isopropylmalate/(R)-2-methylmalate dehydratase small subunit
MKKNINGKVYVLGNNIDTDQIIPAKFLSYNPSIKEERKFFGKYALCGVPEGEQGLPFGDIPFVKDSFSSDYNIIIGGQNFGCGSSREHAPLALSEAGVEVVIANSFARIFYRNSVNGGYIIPYETDIDLKELLQTNEEVEIDIVNNKIKKLSTNKYFELKSLGGILPILEAGDIFNFAKINNIS